MTNQDKITLLIQAITLTIPVENTTGIPLPQLPSVSIWNGEELNQLKNHLLSLLTSK